MSVFNGGPACFLDPALFPLRVAGYAKRATERKNGKYKGIGSSAASEQGGLSQKRSKTARGAGPLEVLHGGLFEFLEAGQYLVLVHARLLAELADHAEAIVFVLTVDHGV